MAHELPSLPYAFDALEPHIDARTMEIHHGKHHAAYVTNLNAALEGHEMASLPVDELMTRLGQVPDQVRTAVQNNGGGHFNHSLFWKIMKPGGGGSPSGELGDAINSTFGSYDDFKAKLTKAGMTRFGSGWAWLSVRNGSLEISSSANQDNPLMDGATPILGVDVWEHAYYLNYQNRRPDYLAAWFNTVNWDQVSENLRNAG